MAIHLLTALRGTNRNRAVFPSLLWVGGDAPDSLRIIIWIPAVVVLSNISKVMLIRLGG